MKDESEFSSFAVLLDSLRFIKKKYDISAQQKTEFTLILWMKKILLKNHPVGEKF